MVEGVSKVHYAERRSSVLPGTVWVSARSGSLESATVLPDGCMDLLWDGSELLVAGPDTAPSPVASPARRYAAVRLDPGVAPGLLRIGADQLRDQRVPLSDLWSSRTTRRWSARLSGVRDPAAALESLLAERHQQAPAPGWVGAVTRALTTGRSVEDAAAAIAFSSRELRRRSLTHFGYGPKLLQRILRVQAAVRVIGAGVAPTRAATDLGYADYPHLQREARALLGLSPTAFVPARPVDHQPGSGA